MVPPEKSPRRKTRQMKWQPPSKGYRPIRRDRCPTPRGPTYRVRPSCPASSVKPRAEHPLSAYPWPERSGRVHVAPLAESVQFPPPRAPSAFARAPVHWSPTATLREPSSRRRPQDPPIPSEEPFDLRFQLRRFP